MKNLYIDYDGVILDTIPIIYDHINKNNIDKEDFDGVSNLVAGLDWQDLVKTTPKIGDPINAIRELQASNKFNISILTHVNSLAEAIAKIEFLEKELPDITIIPVPKKISKTKMVQTKGSILVDDFSGNLKEWASESGIGVKFVKERENNDLFPEITDLRELLQMF